MAGKQASIEPNRKLVARAAVAMVLSVLACLGISLWIVRARPGGPLVRPPSEAGHPPAFGMLEPRPFAMPEAGPGEAQQLRAQAALERWRWNDAAHTSAEVPVARAAQLLVARRGGADAGR